MPATTQTRPATRPVLTGRYVDNDAHKGDRIALNGHIWQVVDTTPSLVVLHGQSDPCRWTSYQELREARAYYTCMLVPCIAPE